MTSPNAGSPESVSVASATTDPTLSPVVTMQPAETSIAQSAVSASRHTKAYPLLLLLSTATAALFCFMYITKPVIAPVLPPVSPPLAAAAKPDAITEPVVADQPPVDSNKSTPPAVAEPPEKGTATAEKSVASSDKPSSPVPSMLPNAERLPGDKPPSAVSNPPLTTDSRQSLPAPSPAPPFEETNLHIQHVLTATSPGGDLSRIVLSVPVIYQSRNLRWTESEIAESRELLKRLTTYQENSRALREEATQLLAAWNHLVERCIPTPVLRADSPSLPANQDQADNGQQPAGLNTKESIKIQPADQ